MALQPQPERAPLEQLSLSELVERSGVPASTIHHYRRTSLIPPPRREAANRFSYDERHVEALRLIRQLRERRGLSLDQIAEALPGLLTDPSTAPEEPADVRAKLIEAAIDAFQTRSYGEVAVSDVAEVAGVAKGSVYRYFASKEELFTAAIETQLAETAAQFAAAVKELGGPEGLADDPEKTATMFAMLVARSLPILLELGARAAKGHDPSQELARRALRTLAEAAGQPLTGAASEGGGADDSAVTAGLRVIETAFATVLAWAVGPDWPPDSDEP